MTTQTTAAKRKRAAREGEGKTSSTSETAETTEAVERTADVVATGVAEDVPPDFGQGALTDEQTRTAWIAGLSLGALGTALAGWVFGPPIAVLVLAGTAAASVIALFWQSLRTLIGEAPLSAADTFAAFSTGTEEEQKRAVLRAMKDLEYERNVGKISEEDFKRLTMRYRTEAKSLLRQIHERGADERAKAEELVMQRLRAAGMGEPFVRPEASKTEDAKAEEAKPEEAKTEEAKTEEAKTEEAKTEEAKADVDASADAAKAEDEAPAEATKIDDEATAEPAAADQADHEKAKP